MIVKSSKSGGNFNIELAERTIGVNYTESTADYEKIIDDLLGKIISTMGATAKTAELTSLKNATLTWTSQDTGTVSISGTTAKGVKVGKTTLVGSGAGKQVTVPINVISGVYLADSAIAVGDYVAYDAGTWSSTVGKPTSHGNFGGYTSGKSKNESVSCDNSSTTLKGWRVLSIDKSSKKVTIVHAGQPECYYHGTNPSDSISKLNTRAYEQYKNTFAESGRSISKTDVDALGSTDTLRKTSTYYWLATAFGSTYLYYVGTDGSIGSYYNSVYGFRPVIVLKSSVLTTGKGTDSYGNSAWKLA